jgi:hypothetical protein
VPREDSGAKKNKKPQSGDTLESASFSRTLIGLSTTWLKILTEALMVSLMVTIVNEE